MSEWFAFETALLLSFETKLQLIVCFSLLPKKCKHFSGAPKSTLNHIKWLRSTNLIKKFPIKPYAEMSEWFKVQPWKGCVREIAPRVRISFSAPNKKNCNFAVFLLCFQFFYFCRQWNHCFAKSFKALFTFLHLF